MIQKKTLINLHTALYTQMKMRYKGQIKVMSELAKSLHMQPHTLKLLSTKIIFIWSSLRAEYAQMMFKEHKVEVERKGMHCFLVYELMEKWCLVFFSLCLCAK